MAAKQRAKTAGGGGGSGAIEGLAELREQIKKELEAKLRSGASADALQHVCDVCGDEGEGGGGQCVGTCVDALPWEKGMCVLGF